MKTNIYIDGFNFYYSCVKNTPYRWLNFEDMCKKLLPENAYINKIKYFTAKVSGRTDSSKPIRQQVYLLALKKYIKNIEIIYGQFKVNNVRMPLAIPLINQKYAEVIKTEEKGTDVNIAVNLLNDAWLNDYDQAILVSNDSDLAEALKLVKMRNKRIGLFLPDNVNTSNMLKNNYHFIKRIRSGLLKWSQLPDPIPGTNIYKPPQW